MKQNLIALVWVLGSLSGVAAQADTLQIEQHSAFYSYAGSNFRFDERKGTAWINVSLIQDQGISLPGNYPPGAISHRQWTVSAPVPGLSYDAAAAQIIFNGQTGKFVCATVTQKNGFFGRKWMIKLTGSCRTRLQRGGRTDSVYFDVK